MNNDNNHSYSIYACQQTPFLQDPLLFSGSIRENLDPFSRNSDERLWEVLEQSELKSFVKEKSEELSYDCGEGGENLR